MKTTEIMKIVEKDFATNYENHVNDLKNALNKGEDALMFVLIRY